MKLLGRRSSLILGIGFAAVALVLSGVATVPVYRTEKRVVTGVAAEGPGAVRKAGEAARRRIAGREGVAGSDACAGGRNGGATDRGVTADTIKLGATVVRSGIGSSFLGGAPVAMQAVASRVNQKGGICGRLLDLRMVNDGWDAQKGLTFLRSLIDEGIFAIPVSPSSEGVNELILSGDLKEKQIPLVGADGMVKSMYKDPWVWPVATSTVSSMHILAQQAYKEGARTFGIVFENDYHFGVEGAKAFNTAVKKLTGRNIQGFNASLSTCQGTFCGIESGRPSYASEVETFNSACKKPNNSSGWTEGQLESQGPGCDLVVLLLEPKTALVWILKSGGFMPGPTPQRQEGEPRVGGPQPLFNSEFAKGCDRRCNYMEVWTSYNPPIAPYADTGGVREFVSTVRSADPSVDISNSFTQGAYLGMKVFVEALEIAGPDLTRQTLRDVLDSGSFDFGMGPKLSWQPGRHLGHGQMQGFQLLYQGNQFVAFRLRTKYVKDRLLGRDL